MTLKDTILYFLIKGSPILNSSIDIYDMLFCVNGNGFCWKNGELVNDSIDMSTIDIYDYIDCDIIKRYNDFEPKEIRAIGKTKGYFFEFYPLSEYSKMVDFPDDIKPDWLNGIKKMIILIETNKDFINSDDYNKTMKWIEIVKNKIKKHEATL